MRVSDGPLMVVVSASASRSASGSGGTSVGRDGATRSGLGGWGLPVPGGSHPHVAEIQRGRLLSAALRVVDELGYANTSVAHITGRARVSRRTFYELFADREACLTAALQGVVGLVEANIVAAGLDGLVWRERVRGGLWAILSFFDREPVLARVCVVESMQGGPGMVAAREMLVARLARVVDEGRVESKNHAQLTPLVAEGLVGAAFSIVYSRLLRREREPLSGLLGELMGLIVLPYLGSAAARREQSRPLPPLPVLPMSGGLRVSGSERLADDPLAGMRIRLTYRTTRVLECVAGCPGASNRRVGEAAGVSDQGQISKLLARLERLGLLQNTGKLRPKGEANAWELTEQGARVVQMLGMNSAPGREPA